MSAQTASHESIAALRRAVALDPRGWLALGDRLYASGDAAGADAAYVEHVRHASKDPALMRAGAALAQNRIPEAETLLRAHLQRAPTDVAAIRMFAELAARVGRLEEAEHLLARALELAPSFHAARLHYALVLNRGNKPTEALAQIERLLRVDPNNPGYRNLHAVVLCRIGEYTRALDIYARLLRQYPAQTKIWMSYGHALKTEGRQDDAIAAYRRCIALDPSFGEAWWSLANLKTLRFDENDLSTMRRQLENASLPVEHRFHLEFALGKALEDAGEHAESFAHYESGNRHRRETAYYNPEDNTSRVRLIKRTYTKDFFAQRVGSGSEANDPIFIVGMPRAGSTLIEQILSSHSAVEGTMELPEIIAITREMRRSLDTAQSQPYHEALASLDRARLRELGEDYLERTRIHRKSGAPRFIDKMPNNFAHIGLIHLALPNAKIIDARRHPLACCFSNFKQHYARGQNFSYSLDDIGRYYRDYVELMAHYDDILPGRVHRVFYERMVDDTEGEVRRLLDYLGLPFEANCLRFYENDRPVRTASSEQVRRPIYKDGVDQWRHYEPWLDPLKAALGPVLEAYPAST
ncbi:tetratricopeptide repeat-containing sulfotransferase family protein [Noviluteimonas gilva]|uniref:Tetratricopeptide repeat protein n=1 Tax=Noviluteimonas gilva TaxID=2682097 RepID=A0A7C9M0F8_9GAMM|nr:tetratricopeptide repeat-containing sulfotransferase family protein [Lysobacter gilvus]MUV13628.1 tetratricopeptide repeat protein [Lysobacter gilvus]